MGPVEKELRKRVDWPYEELGSREWLSFQAFRVLMDAELSLGAPGPMHYVGRSELAQTGLRALWPDIWSEAIEAAAELGL